jgi:baculoviral IAP repeat-containing protein 6
MPTVFFSLSSSGLPFFSPQATFSEVLSLTSPEPIPSLSLFVHVSRDPVIRESFVPRLAPATLPPSMLETFASAGGLSLLSHCLPSLHPSFWPTQSDSPSLVAQRPFSLSSPPDTPSPHSLVTLGLCLRLRCYGDFLLKQQPMARTLLLMLLGAEYKDTVTPAMSEQLPFVPYLVLLQLLTEYQVPNEVGVACREGVMRGGVIHQLLSSLSALGHRPRVTPLSSSNQDLASSTVPRPDRGGMGSRHRLYWAKGTGFGTGSTTSEWNMDAMRAKQKSEEKHVCLVFAILWECLARPEGCGQGAESWCDSALADLLASSCLLPALATYLVNDSILDIAKHTELYLSALGLLYSFTLHPSLLSLLTLPIFPASGDPPPMTSSSSDGRGGLSLVSLSRRLKTTVMSYSKAARLKTAVGVSNKATPTRGEQLPLPPPRPPQRVRQRTGLQTKDEGISPEADVVELTSAMLATAERVMSTAAELGGGEEGEGGREETNSTDSTDEYMQTMSPLQFDTFQIVEEDENGKLSVLVPFHYENRLKPSQSSTYGPARARRLAQEVSALATSLPLSSSSSVFVRCDENRLDVMKVLITGPSDTPYANGCFVFDILFPEEYPQGPMLVNLLTTGQGTVRFNPNLYNDGKVCLSVLNTWHGRPEEKWNSETSSFLQVLVSIQSLVLVPDPYFNEPGYEQYRGTPYGDQKSLTYNANLYVATIQWAMIHQLQNPSPCFREVPNTRVVTELKASQLRNRPIRENLVLYCSSSRPYTLCMYTILHFSYPLFHPPPILSMYIIYR